MGKVYLFNMQPLGGGSTPMMVYVNGNSTAYQIPFTRKSFDFVPYSTSGDRAPGSTPQGNKFVQKNLLAIDGALETYDYQFDLPSTSLPSQDVILFIFRKTLVLLDTVGRIMEQYTPVGAQRARTGAARSTAADNKGVVYTFDINAESIKPVSTNGGDAGDVDGWSNGSGPPVYQPNVLPINRVLNRSEGRGNLYNGDNDVQLNWVSAAGDFTLTIRNDEFPISQDLLLYTFRSHWILADQWAAIRHQGSIDSKERRRPAHHVSKRR